MKKSKTFIKILTAMITSSLLFSQVVPSEKVYAKNTGSKLVVGEINPELKEYLKNKDTLTKSGTIDGFHFVQGDIPLPVKFPQSKGNTKAPSNLSLPSKYDLRKENRLSPVKNQGGIGSCWSFATYGSLESWMLGKGKGTTDFSENNLITHHGFDSPSHKGGNIYMSTAYLSRWDGPVTEADDPYASPANPENIKVRDGKTPQKHVQDVIYIPSRAGFTANDDIKAAIMQYGALYTSISYDDKYYNEATNSFYTYETAKTNHGVGIVGWDDTYSKDNFGTKPAGNGAFIIRNSWGSDWGDGGYFYMSYYDTCVGKVLAAYIDAEDTNNYDKVYQYDPLGMVNNVGFDSKTAWFSNVFTAGTNETLSAVSFYTANKNADYEIYLETDYDKNNFKTLSKIQTGTIDMPGYRTVKLDKSTALSSGKKFAVVVKLTESDETAPIAIEEAYKGYSSKATANIGESFISADGLSWEDLKQSKPELNANVCLKAFTTLSSTPTTDTTPPVVLSSQPTNGAVDLDVNSTISTTFSEKVQAGNAFAAITLSDGKVNMPIKCTILDTKLLISASLNYKTKYTLTIPQNAVKDLAGNQLLVPSSISFTTKDESQADPYEPNNTLTTAYSINSGANYDAYLYSKTDVDYYKINVTKAGSVSIRLTNLPKDYDMYLYNSKNQLLASSQKSGTLSESINYNVIRAGEYYIMIDSFDHSFDTTNKYRLNATFN